MSLIGMPILILNLGGEMVYILEQRLDAQKVANAKAKQVIRDTVKTMCNSKFISELFKPQHLYDTVAVRQIFERLAHCSIMRLSESSMDKLYDLMTIAFKYQIVTCSTASDIVKVTLNHLETIRSMVDEQSVLELVDTAIAMVHQRYGSLSAGDIAAVRHDIVNFLQDRRVKVSLLIQDGIQNNDGSFVINPEGCLPPSFDKPGEIKYFSDGDMYANNSVDMPTRDIITIGDESVCTLGTNLYCNAEERKEQRERAKQSGVVPKTTAKLPTAPAASVTKEQAKSELNMLANLIGGAESGSTDFKVNLFPDLSMEPTGNNSSRTARSQTIVIEKKADLKSRVSALGLDDVGDSGGGGGGDDLLDLMDSAT